MCRSKYAFLVALLLSASPAVADPLAWESALRSPLYVTHHALAIDPAGRRGVTFGGLIDGALSDQAAFLDLDAPAPRWTRLLGSGGPSARRDAHAFYDAPRGRFLVFGGADASGDRQDLWALDPSTEAWTELTPGPSPPPGVDPSDPVVYDSRRGRLVLVLSQDAGPCELWALDVTAPGAAWALLAMTDAPLLGPSAGAAYDSTGDRVLVLGGIDNGLGGGNQSRTLRQADLTTGTWRALHPATCLTTLHVPRLAVDEATRRLIVHQSNGDLSSSCQVSSFDLGATVTGHFWLVGNEPAYVDGQAFAFDALTGRLLVHGGEPSILLHALATREAFEWSSLVLDDGLPRATLGMAGAVDPVGRTWYIHGGYSRTNARVCSGLPPGAHCLSADLYRIDLDDPRRVERLFPAGGGPGVLYDHVAVFDSIGHRILFHGGYDSVGTIRNEVWALELEGPLRWTPVATTAPQMLPGPALQGHAAAIDAARRIMYAVGGSDQSLWALNLNVEPARWSLVRLGFLGVSDAIVGFDPVTRRLLIHNWNQSESEFEVDLNTPAATVTTLVGDGTHGLSMGVGAWDSRRRRLLSSNGFRYCFCNSFGWPFWGVWSLRDHGTLEYGEIGVVNGAFVPMGRSIAAYDPVRDRMLVHSGIDDDFVVASAQKHGVWTLQFDVSTPTRLDLVDAVAGAGGNAIHVRFSGEGPSGEVRVERATGVAADDWEDVGAAAESTPGLYEFNDASVVRGVPYRYRGRWFADGIEKTTAASEPVALPAAGGAGTIALRARAGAIVRAWPVEFEVRLPGDGPAVLELVDVAGRVVARQAIAGGVGEGARVVALAPSRGAGAGLYFARLRQGEVATLVRVVRL